MSKDIYGLEYHGTNCENKKFLNKIILKPIFLKFKVSSPQL